MEEKEEDSRRDKSCCLQTDQECNSSRKGMKEVSCVKHLLLIPFSETLHIAERSNPRTGSQIK